MNQPKRMTIDEIEALLSSDDEIELDILPNGEVRSHPARENTKQGSRRDTYRGASK